MSFDSIFEKIFSGNNKKMEKEIFEKQIQILTEILPDWCSLQMISKNRVLKLELNLSKKSLLNNNSKKKLKDVLNVIQEEIEKSKNNK